MIENVPRIIWQFWTGTNELTQNRIRCLKSNANFGIETKLLMGQELMEMQVSGHPYHPAYQYLSYVHRSDYLRCYFAHYYGGGYADIKEYSRTNWIECFNKINNDDSIFGIGQREGLAGSSSIPEFRTPDILDKLISMCYFIMRPHTEFTEMWLGMINDKLDLEYDKLKSCWEYTKNDPYIRKETNSKYPLRWVDIGNHPFHLVQHKFLGTERILTGLQIGRTKAEYR